MISKNKLKLFVITALLTLQIFSSLNTAFCASETSNASINGQNFYDVPSDHWAFSYINEMSSRGVLSGYPDGSFYPEKSVTRAEFSKIMCLASGLKVKTVTSTSYSDVDVEDWFAPYVEAGKYYLSGYVSNGQKFYMPDSNALREDIAVALVKLKGYDTSIYDESILKTMFTDWQSISEGARKYVSVAVEKGLISGFEDNTFRGQDTVTRAQASALLWRAYQYGNDNKVFEEEEPVIEKEDNIGPLSISIKSNTSHIEIDEGDYAEFKIFITSNQKGEYTPGINGDSSIIEDYTVRSTDECNTIYTYKTTNLSAGEYKVTFVIDDDIKTHRETVTIIVNTPEPEYSYEIDTVLDNCNFSRTEWSSLGIVSRTWTENSGIYLIGNMTYPPDGSDTTIRNEKVIEIKNGKVKTLADCNSIDYLGDEELTKKEMATLTTGIYSVGYNSYDNCPYAILGQKNKLYLYNLYTEKYKPIEEYFYVVGYMGNTGVHKTEFGKNFSPGMFASSMTMFSVDEFGNVIVDSTIIDDKICLQRNICYEDKRTGEMINVRLPDNPYYNILFANNQIHYATTLNENSIYTIDINGNIELLFDGDDIKILDEKIFDIRNSTYWNFIADNSGNIYFYDEKYDAIRCIRKK